MYIDPKLPKPGENYKPIVSMNATIHKHKKNEGRHTKASNNKTAKKKK